MNCVCVTDPYLLSASNPMKLSLPILNPFLYSLIPLLNCITNEVLNFYRERNIDQKITYHIS